MVSATEMKSIYARQIRGYITLMRLGSSPTQALVRARIVGYQPNELVGDIVETDRKAIVLAEDVAASGFPVPIRAQQDRVIYDGRTWAISSVDDTTRRVDDVLIAYELRISGA